MTAFIPEYDYLTPPTYEESLTYLFDICAKTLMDVYMDTSFNSLALGIDSIQDKVSTQQFLNHRQLYGGSLCIGTALEVKHRLPDLIQSSVRLHMPYSDGNRSSMHGFLAIWYNSEVLNIKKTGILILDTHANFGKPILLENGQPAKAKWNSKPFLEAEYKLLPDGTLQFQRDEPKPLLLSPRSITLESSLELSLTTLAQYPYLAIICSLITGGPKAFVKLHLEDKYIKFYWLQDDNSLLEYTEPVIPNQALNWDKFPNWITEDLAILLKCGSLKDMKDQIDTIWLGYDKLMDYRKKLKERFQL